MRYLQFVKEQLEGKNGGASLKEALHSHITEQADPESGAHEFFGTGLPEIFFDVTLEVSSLAILLIDRRLAKVSQKEMLMDGFLFDLNRAVKRAITTGNVLKPFSIDDVDIKKRGTLRQKTLLQALNSDEEIQVKYEMLKGKVDKSDSEILATLNRLQTLSNPEELRIALMKADGHYKESRMVLMDLVALLVDKGFEKESKMLAKMSSGVLTNENLGGSR